ncbi:MAG: hypothetical protein ABIQ11_06895 [Saprospiraceae bacterium]
MSQPNRLVTIFQKPVYQSFLVVILILFLTGMDSLMPHDDEFFKVNAGPWIVSTAMVLLFILINTIVALRIENITPYWIQSVMVYLGLLAFSYGWCFLLSGKHIDDVGSFRWLWIVITMVYFVFFGIARSMKRIVDFAIEQDKKLRGEE